MIALSLSHLPHSLCALSVAVWPLRKLDKTDGPSCFLGQKPQGPWWSPSTGQPVIGSELSCKVAVVGWSHRRGEWRTKSFWLACEILWQPLLEAFGKGQFAPGRFCPLASYWDKKMRIWVLELPFGVNHPAVLFPFLLHDRFPRLFLFGVIG